MHAQLHARGRPRAALFALGQESQSVGDWVWVRQHNTWLGRLPTGTLRNGVQAYTVARFPQVQHGQLVRAAEDLQLLVAVCQDKSLHLESVTYLLLMAQVSTRPPPRPRPSSCCARAPETALRDDAILWRALVRFISWAGVRSPHSNWCSPACRFV